MDTVFPSSEREARSRGWQWVPLGKVLEQRNELVHPRNNPTGKATFVGLEHVERDTGRRLGSLQIDRATITGRRAEFRAGDIVYGYLRPYLNKVWVADRDGLCSVDQYVYRVRAPLALTEFVANYLRSDVYLSLAPIETGQLPRIRTEEVAATPIPLPDLVEQARVLRSIEEKRAAVGGVRNAAKKQADELAFVAPAFLRAAFLGAL
jgi:type I restriction enzyme, S subunit